VVEVEEVLVLNLECRKCIEN